MKKNTDNVKIKLPWITIQMREFNLSHMPNLLDTNIIK